MIYFTADLHLNHNNSIIYSDRGFVSLEAMNKFIVDNWRATDEDDVYILGDLAGGEINETFINLVSSLRGKLHIIRGNHDSEAKIGYYKSLSNIVEVVDAKYLEYKRLKFFVGAKRYNFYLSHFPAITKNFGDIPGEQGIISLFGHTHQREDFYDNNWNMYHVGMDSHDCKLVSINEIIDEIEKKCKEQNNGK